jgi:general secretion pathway protein I
VIIAFALLALGLSLLLGTLSGAARQVRWSGDAGRAALYAQSLLDQVVSARSWQPGRTEGDVDGGRYHWSLSISPWVDATAPASTQPRSLQGRACSNWS